MFSRRNFWSSPQLLLENEPEEEIFPQNEENIGPVEIEEPFNIFWNANDWPFYIKCPFSAEYSHLAIIIREGWKLNRPKIIIAIVSQFSALQWDNETQINRLKDGIIKAASATNMWIATNGIDVGASQIIAEAIENEKKWQQSMMKPSTILKTKCIGIVRDDRITTDPLMQRNLRDIEKLNETDPLHMSQREKPKENRFYIDSHHNHFIFVSKEDESDLEQLFALELLCELSQPIAWWDEHQLEALERKRFLAEIYGFQTPLIAILIQGDSNSAFVVLQYLLKQLPVVVLQGSGGLADLLAYAYVEIEDRYKQEGLWDQDFVEELLKPSLCRKIVQMFPEFREKMFEVRAFRDKVVECCRYASQEGIEYLTILNVHSTKIDLERMDQYLLDAYFKSKATAPQPTTSFNPQLQLTEDLDITLSWNTPSIARNMISKRFSAETLSIDKELFKRALVESGREEFVDIFLEAGFFARQLYNFATLKWLIAAASRTEFFLVVCCEGILGISMTMGFPLENFLSHLNRLIQLTTGFGDFLRHDDLTVRSKATPNCIELKALAFIAMWAVFTNNLVLVDKIWRYHSEPINLILMVCTMLTKMSAYVNDLSLRKEMEVKSVEYGELATALLEEYYLNAPFRATDALTLQSPHWSYQSASDVAVSVKVHSFIAHPCCQRFLTNRFMNHMHIKQSPYGDLFMPQGIKIILSAILVLPIYLWLDFPQHVTEKKEALAKDTALSRRDGMEQQATAGDARPFAAEELDGNKGKLTDIDVNSVKDITLWEKWLIVWDAAIAKYWLHQIFYILFLVSFTYDVILPGCGNRKLDIFIFLWMSLALVEDIRKTYVILKKYISVSITLTYIEIMLMIFFLCVFYLGRIIRFPPLFKHQYVIKMLMCCALFHAYCKYLAIFIPISSTFGPLFYRLQLMTFNDFVQFMIICTPIMVGSAIVIRVSHFPDENFFGKESLVKTFHTTFFTLFRTYDDDLRLTDRCRSQLVVQNERPIWANNTCITGDYYDPTCNHNGFWPYVFNIIYLVLLKLVLTTLLYALFNNSLATLDAQTIWRYQRFRLTSDFNVCLPLPPPLSIICYFYYLIKWTYQRCCCRNNNMGDIKDSNVCHACPNSTSRYFAKMVCTNVVNSKAEKEQLETALAKLKHHSTLTADHLEYTKAQLNKLRRTIAGLQRMIYHLQADVEAAKQRKTKKLEEIQRLSRLSPYPSTTVERTPVADKFIPWEVQWADYDPNVYSQGKDSFPAALYADDETILQPFEKRTVPTLKAEFRFNSVYKTPNVLYDRISWIPGENKKAFQYKVDGIVPLNPFGRTGLAGRGGLPRWGPNHYILLFVTRHSANDKDIYEFLTKTNEADLCCLVGGFVPSENRYEIVEAVLEPRGPFMWKKAEDMISYFEHHVISSPKSEEPPSTVSSYLSAVTKSGVRSHSEARGLQYKLVSRGYMDDPFNTDNAWKEVEFWHFHFTEQESVSSEMDTDILSWTVLTEGVLDRMPLGESNLLQNCTQNWKRT